MNPRNLVVFIDGTSNQPGDKNTNVMKLFSNVTSTEDQVKEYFEGIGVHNMNELTWLRRRKTEAYSALEMAFAWNVEKNVKGAYHWLAERYKEGDRIYLFGFSRGAFQVRKLASMIHEVGLVLDQGKTEMAYDRYLTIDPLNLETRQTATKFKMEFARPGVRVHFIGVWDTVSSLGLVKRDAHVTVSATVTNACHFRHALALDEHRVKFMPEYFLEMNAHCSSIRSQRSAVGDVQEVWFAGCHSDVGGTDRPVADSDSMIYSVADTKPYTTHAGNVPLLWMRQEAATSGLAFDPMELCWDPEDVIRGRTDSMKSVYKFFEILPIRHQTSFSGTGEHKLKWHLSRPRLVIPTQKIHSSVSFGDMYTPLATLGDVGIPIIPQRASDGLWSNDFLDEEATRRLLTELLNEGQTTLKYLKKVLFLLDLRLGNGWVQAMPRPNWSEVDISRHSHGFTKFSLTVIYDAASESPVSDELLNDAKQFLIDMLPDHDTQHFHSVLHVLRFLTKHQIVRRRFVADVDVIKALMFALERAVEHPEENSFLLIVDSLYHLVEASDGHIRDMVIEQLGVKPDGDKARGSRLSAALGVRVPDHLRASLKVVMFLAQHTLAPDLCETLEPRIYELAVKKRGPVGSAAVEVLVALDALHRGKGDRDIPFVNILGYLDSTLPRLDAEVGGTASPQDIDHLPPVLLNHSGGLDTKTMGKLVLTIGSRSVHDRTVATLTLLKLCRNATIRESCKHGGIYHVLDNFMQQLEKQKTSLLAAYALKTCLGHGMWTPDDYPGAAQLIANMLDKGWFDDAVGRIEGCEIFRGLITNVDLKQQVLKTEHGVVANLVKKLEGGERHDVRRCLSYLDILGSAHHDDPLDLEPIVTQSLTYLKHKDEKVQKKGVKTLSALAQTTAGEQAIKPQLIKIVQMITLHRPSQPRSQLFGPAAALYALCRNETLREQIKGFEEFATWKDQREAT